MYKRKERTKILVVNESFYGTFLTSFSIVLMRGNQIVSPFLFRFSIMGIKRRIQKNTTFDLYLSFFLLFVVVFAVPHVAGYSATFLTNGNNFTTIPV